ncbi:tetratricopeptide repeat protein [Flavobacterium piscinae]|uniref:tetratricopeptide repeat protein n=1 Tax=Flavobacterium piscinae TaxID=2506424 RepID=UPI001FE3AA91|nr:tetratricopeptide repeat protein [Flavobacterium piscinae]
MSDNQQHLIELNLSEYTFLLNNPNAVNEKQAKALETVVESFPYFQSARALYLKGLYNQDSYKYNFALKQTAAHTADRSVLFDFITSDEFTIIEKDIYEKKLALLMDIDVVDSEIHHVEELVSEKTDEIDTPEITSISVKPTVEFESAEIDFVKLENNSILEEVKEEITVSEITPTLIEVEPIIEEEKIEPNPINLAENEVEETIISTENSEDLIEEATTKEVTSIDENSFESLSEEVIPEIKEKLDIGKPITFSQNEKHSFQEWLQLASFKPIERIEVKKETLSIQNSVQKEEKKHENSSSKLKKLEIIDKFIEANPKITPAKELVDLPSKPIETSDTTHLMTETLARVYLEQKKYSKAIQAYEILILKYPEKSIFFADRIKDIKILQQNNQ